MLEYFKQRFIENFLNSRFKNYEHNAKVDDKTFFVFTNDPLEFLLENDVQKIYQFNNNCPRLIRLFENYLNIIIKWETMFDIIIPSPFFYPKNELNITSEPTPDYYLFVLRYENGIVTKIIDDTAKIEYVRIQHSIFSILCAKMNFFVNGLPVSSANHKNFNSVFGGGKWLYNHSTKNIELMEYPFPATTHSKNATGENNKIFIDNNMELIKACIQHFVGIVESQFTDFQFENKYKFTICTRQSRGTDCDFHKDGSDLFLLFIYPKAVAIGTYLSGNSASGKTVNNVDEKVLPKVNQCDAIMIDNNKLVHATPDVFSESREDLAFIRIAMKKYDETNASTQKQDL